MKVFFTASQRGKKQFGKYYKIIFDYLNDLSYHHVDDIIVRMNSDAFYKNLEKKGLLGDRELYDKNMKAIKMADIIIFECSVHSSSIGFMIQKALELNKPVIALYMGNHLPYFLGGIKEEKFVLAEYNKDNLKQVLKKLLNQTKVLVDTRFNFFINPRLLEYLQKTSKELGITKSSFIRNLILQHMKQNKSSVMKET